MGTAAPRPTTIVTVGSAVTTGSGNTTITSSATTFETTDNPYGVAEHALNGAAGNIVRGWAGPPGEGWSEQAKPYDRPGSAEVGFKVSIDDQLETFSVRIDTSGSLARAIVHAAHAMADAAQSWVIERKRAAHAAQVRAENGNRSKLLA